MPRKKSDRVQQLFRLTNLTDDEYRKRHAEFSEMAPAVFLLDRLLSFLTPEDVELLMLAWAEERRKSESRLVLP